MQKINAFAERRAKNYQASSDPVIGCIELADVVTLDDDAFVLPENLGHGFPRQVVKLKYFSEPDQIAVKLGSTKEPKDFTLVDGTSQHKPTLRKDRKGQSAFRQEILSSYRYRCCVLDDGIIELLEAAHIQPYVDERSNHPQNGICLRVDLHRLFDEGLLMISEDYKLRVSPSLAGIFYASLEDKLVSLPSSHNAKPSPSALASHRRSFR